jgi:hypothetical protein
VIYFYHLFKIQSCLFLIIEHHILDTNAEKQLSQASDALPDSVVAVGPVGPVGPAPAIVVVADIFLAAVIVVIVAFVVAVVA